MRYVWILPVLALVALAIWMGTRPSGVPAGRNLERAAETVPVPEAAWTDRPSLRGARERSPVPRGLVLRIRSSDDRGVPADLVGVLATPPSLRSERVELEGGAPSTPIDRTFSSADAVDGRVHLTGLRYRLWDLRVVAPGFLGVARELVLPPLADGEPPIVDVVLDPFARIRVRVSDADGAPVANAAVRVAQPDLHAQLRDRPLHHEDDPGPRARGVARTDARGGGALEALPGNVELQIAVNHPEHPPKIVTVHSPAPGAERTVEVQLERPAGIRGEVDLAAFGVQAAAIVLTDYRHEGTDSSFEARVPIAADGTFVRRNVRPGRHTIQVTGRGPHGARTALHPVLVPPETMVDVGLIRPGTGSALRFLVHVEEPIPEGARVRAVILRHRPVPEAGAEPVEEATSADAFAALEFVLPIGRVHEVHGVPEGTLACHFMLVDARGRDASVAHHEPRVAVTPAQRAETIEVVFRHRPPPPPTVTTTFRVRPPKDVAPSALRWSLVILDEDGRLRGGSARRMPAGTAQSSGASEAIDVPVAVYVLGHGQMAGPRRVPHLAERSTLEFTTWQPAALVSLRVEDVEGSPLVGVTVDVSLQPTGRTIAYTETTDDEGRVTFTVIPGMDLHVKAHTAISPDPVTATLRAGEIAPGARATRTLRVEEPR